METRSNHVLVGGVVLGLIVAMFGFIVWIAGLSQPATKEYDIFFEQSVDGLANGSSVTFAGVPVGKVKAIVLNAQNPQFVRVRIAIDEDVPILQGVTATIASVGFTGVSQINLNGAMKGAPPITKPGPFGKPVIPTKPGALGELLNSAPALLERLTVLTERLGDLLSPDNQRSIGGILANVDRLTGSLADRGPEIASALAESRVAIRQVGEAAEQMGALANTTGQVVQSDVRPAMQNLSRALVEAQQSIAEIDVLVADARPGVQTFSTQTIPEVNQLVRDLAQTSQSLSSITGRLDKGGAGALVGGQKLPEYKPRH